MSQLNINTIKNKRGDYGPNLVGHSTVTGDLNVTGNITGDGSGLTGLGNTANIKSDTISNSGIITSTGFVGPLTGDVTGGVTGNLTGNVTGDVTGNLTGDVTGDVTGNLTGNVTGNITGTTGTFSGNVSVGGTLTYEDVTNVDSVGVITARTGVRVNAGGIVVTAGISTLGAGVSLTGPYKENITVMGALEVDCSTGNYFTKTISGDSTFTFANVPTNCAYAFTLELTHTSGTVTWPASVKFPADTAPTLTAGKTHLFMFITDDGGTRFRGSSLVDYVN